MIQEVTGDLLTCGADMICHQANFYGVMGAGVARSIWNKLLDTTARNAYCDLCRMHGCELLGTVQTLPFIRADGSSALVCNLFCQDDRVQDDGSLTRYDCMRRCLEQVEWNAKLHGQVKSVALPGGMGCGIAGGDWNTVRAVIEDVFGKSPVPCTIVYLDRR